MAETMRRSEVGSSSSCSRGETVVVDNGRCRSSCGYCKSPGHSSISHGLSAHSITDLQLMTIKIFLTRVGEDPDVSCTNLRWKEHAAHLILSAGQVSLFPQKSNGAFLEEYKGS